MNNHSIKVGDKVRVSDRWFPDILISTSGKKVDDVKKKQFTVVGLLGNELIIKDDDSYATVIKLAAWYLDKIETQTFFPDELFTL